MGDDAPLDLEGSEGGGGRCAGGSGGGGGDGGGGGEGELLLPLGRSLSGGLGTATLATLVPLVGGGECWSNATVVSLAMEVAYNSHHSLFDWVITLEMLNSAGVKRTLTNPIAISTNYLKL